MERNISSLGETSNRFMEARRTSRKQVRNKVGSPHGDHRSHTDTKALTDQGHSIDDTTTIVSTPNLLYLLLHFSLILMMAVKVTLS